MFYYLSKIAWFLVNPQMIAVLLTLATCVLCFTPWSRLRRVFAALAAGFILFNATIPAGNLINHAIERRFPANPALPTEVDGIIVLGGAVDPEMTIARGQSAVGGSFDRVIAFADLADRFPDARLVYSGGSHAWVAGVGEAEVVAPLLERLGVDTDRVLFEADSRNTHQNATYSLKLAAPKPDETWVLITSGYHMPRAVGTFRQAGWPQALIAYPVDFRFLPDYTPTWFSFNLRAGFGTLNSALHEVLGMIAYYVTDRSDSLFPGPEPPE